MEFELVATIERYPPDIALRYAELAERCGFDAVGVPDHFHPWVHSWGQSGFCWVWIAIALERLKRVQVGSCVTAPTIRYHPAVVAQAFATLGYLYPSRVYLGVGTGEPMNELPLGLEWPSHRERLERLREAITIIRLLWTKNRVTFRGKYYRLVRATLYTKPRAKVPILVAGAGPKTARMAGELADGLITVPHLKHELSEILGALKEGARAAGRDPGEMIRAVHMLVSYDEDYDRALDATEPWAPVLLPVLYKYGVFDPVEMEECGRLVGREVRAKTFLIATEPEHLIKRLEELARAGFTRFQFNNSSPEPPKFIEVMGREVIPYLREEFSGELGDSASCRAHRRAGTQR